MIDRLTAAMVVLYNVRRIASEDRNCYGRIIRRQVHANPSVIPNPRGQREEASCSRQTNEVRQHTSANTVPCDGTVCWIPRLKQDLAIARHSKTIRRTGAEA
jgi:hypothetical protein